MRPIDSQALAGGGNRLPEIELVPITAIADDWDSAIKRFFAEGGLFDRIYTAIPPVQDEK